MQRTKAPALRDHAKKFTIKFTTKMLFGLMNLVIRHWSFVIRHSSFVIPHSSFSMLSVIAHEINALFDLRQRSLPVILVFDGDVPIEPLFLELVEGPFDVAHSLPVRHIVAFSIIRFVFEMAADDML